MLPETINHDSVGFDKNRKLNYMTQQSHDHNFKNIFSDFPKEALEWILPEAIQKYGNIRHIEFLRQEPKKRRLSDPHMALDLPILFTFDLGKVILWLVEFQEDRYKFSLYTLLRYLTDMAEAYPDTLIIPTVVFTDRRKWRKDVPKELDLRFGKRIFLHFAYVLIRLFEFSARDYYNSGNPLVRILLPKMKYKPEERKEVIVRAYTGLFQLASLPLFEKYTDFIDIYADVSEEERDEICQELSENKETVMIAQYIKDMGRQEGLQQGRIYLSEFIMDIIEIKFGSVPPEIRKKIENISDLSLLKSLHRQSVLAGSLDAFGEALRQSA